MYYIVRNQNNFVFSENNSVANASGTTKPKEEKTMKAEFYDVKAKASVTAEVTEKVQYPNGRYAFKAKTADGRSLTRFVKEADFKDCDAPVAGEAKKCAKKCCKKK